MGEFEENKERIKYRIKEIVKKVNDPKYELSWEKGEPKFKDKENIKRGGNSRAHGARFELKVRHDLEGKGKIVDKWNNNIDLLTQKLIIAKKKFNPFRKFMTIGTGFPDFVAISHVRDGLYRVIGVEVKVNGILSKEEKEKCKFYLEKEIFSDIWVAKEKRDSRKIEIEYIDFREKYMKETNKT
ncbi:MAG: hypothetical protein NUV46_00915 [Nanoarchaeota archaeon]|nr:hypothetical protein [Nanoarchaeota archaeon]